MITNKSKIRFIRKLLDFILLNIVFLFSATVAQSLSLLLSNKLMFLLMFILNVMWYFTADILGLYKNLSATSFYNNLSKLIKNIIVQAFTAILFLFAIKEPLFLRNFVFLYSTQLLILIGVGNLLLNAFIRNSIKQGNNVQNLIIIGAGEIGQNFLNTISLMKDSGYNFIGFLDEKLSDSNYLGTINNLESILTSSKIDDVVIALPGYELNKVDSIIKICNRYAVRTYIIPDYFKFLSSRFKLDFFNNIPLITVREEPLAEFHWKILKRLFDIFFSFLFIILILSWLIPLIAAIQKLTSKGHVFFLQNRIGINNKVFRCIKFRSMYDFRKFDQDFTAIKQSDPRVTPFGKFLRKYNIDELPQFLNVFLGNMSIVGPRPNAIAFDKKYKEYVDEFRLRHLVKPGITGWAQIHGFRGDSQDTDENKILIRKRFEYDLWYIDNWTFGLDLQIIITTFYQMLRGSLKGK
jgi:putative colanic acid biosysnthesis UDP-glucose lipid carrier transferase